METNETKTFQEQAAHLMAQFEIESLDLTNKLSMLALELNKDQEATNEKVDNS